MDDAQRERLEIYARELAEMNRRINLVSREDVDHVASRHIPHCLTLAMRRFPSGSTVVDWGTGGGLPLIPLAIVFPEVSFIGVDAVRKKTQAVATFSRRLGLSNVNVWHGRAEQFDGEADISVSRATAPIDQLWFWHSRVVRATDADPMPTDEWPRGSLVCLKGGDLAGELSALPGGLVIERDSVAPLLSDEYFATKEILCVTRADGQP
jgi:16S rRNA (guanine527-N7)-methyltransferase